MRENSKKSSMDERILVFGLAIFLCVFLGPFATSEDFDVWSRLAFWTLAITVVGLVMEASMVAVLESRWFFKWNIAIKLSLGAMIGAIPGTSFIVAINLLFRPEHLVDATFPLLWAKVTIMALMIAGLEHLIWIRFRAPQHARLEPSQPNSANTIVAARSPEPVSKIEPPQTVTIPRLYLRLPDRLREGQIISMSMQDHYVEVTTTLGSEMLLMRLSDAIDLLDGMIGVQTHRSHWVALGHICGLAKVARRYEITLSDGRKIPVSTSYKDALEALLHEKGQT